MEVFTHIIIGTLFCLRLLGKISPEAIILLWIMAIFPDIDLFLDPIAKKRNLYFLSHKAASHSYIIGIIITGIFGVILSLWRGVPFFETWVAGAIGFSIHISLDFFGASKVPIFYPFSKREFRVIADRAINPLLGLFSGINLLIILTYFYIQPYYNVLMALSSFYIITYLGYFGFRMVLRIVVQIRLPNGSHYIPGFTPFSYLVYSRISSEESKQFNLKKKFTFSLKQKPLLHQNFSNEKGEITYIEQAMQISQEFRFFHKWNSIIPFFQENKQKVKVVLILAESYSKMRSYFLSVVIHKETKQILSKEDGFGSFQVWENKEF